MASLLRATRVVPSTVTRVTLDDDGLVASCRTFYCNTVTLDDVGMVIHTSPTSCLARMPKSPENMVRMPRRSAGVSSVVRRSMMP